MKQVLVNIIKEWQNRTLPEITARDIDLSIYLNLKIRKVITITGFRRVGKTFLLMDLARKVGQKNCVYINFEDERLSNDISVLTDLTEAVEEYFGKRDVIFLLDEIQNIQGYSRWVRRIVETTNHKIFMTGSSSKLSSNELPTELRGRSINVKVKSLNFNEFLRFKNIDIKNLTDSLKLNYLREYLKYGGFPEVVLADEGLKYLIIDEYYDTFVQRDLIERYKIRNEDVLKALIDLLVNSKEYTITKLTNSLSGTLGKKISKNTISRYVSYLESSFFLESLYLHNQSIKKRYQAPRKIYFIDSFFISRMSSSFSDNWGRLCEQKVYESLKSKKSDRPFDLFYFKNRYNHEVDFILRFGEKTEQLIQVSYIQSDGVLPERETRALFSAGLELKTNNLSIITWDKRGMFEKNGLRINLFTLLDWLITT